MAAISVFETKDQAEVSAATAIQSVADALVAINKGWSAKSKVGYEGALIGF